MWRILIHPHAWTTQRAAFSPVIPLLFYSEWLKAGFALAIYLAATDALDGYFARSNGNTTKFGAWYDPVADFVYCASIFATVFVVHSHGAELLAMWIGILCYFLYDGISVAIIRYRRRVYASNWYAKAKICVFMASLLLILLNACLDLGSSVLYAAYPMIALATALSVEASVRYRKATLPKP